MSWLIHDLECENIPHLGHIASPFHPDNYIVATGWAFNDLPVQHMYFNSKEEANASNWVDCLAEATIYVAHNATFEIQWLMHRHRDAFLNFLKKGGRIFCTQYAEYLLSNQTHQYPSLDEVAPKYGGTTKIDAVKLLWEQGARTSEIEQSLLIEYLAGEGGDIENTRKACFGQYAELAARDMLDMFWIRMDSLLFNAIATFNGLYVDREVAGRNHLEQIKREDELREQVMQLLPSDLPETFEFNFGSGYHMSAWLFGGCVAYKKKVSYEPKKYEKVDAWKVGDNYITIEDGQSPPDFCDLYKAGKNKGQPKVYSVETEVEKLKWGEGVYRFDGLINLTTLPIHVQEQYLGKRAEFRGKQELVCGTPVYSTGKDSLDILAVFTDVAKPLKELAALQKDNGTYYISYEYDKDGNVKRIKGMLQYVGDDGIIHHSLNGTSTITGRLSSSQPNLQNLPRDGTSRVKEMFASRFGSEGKIVEVDYTALEVVTLAAISNDTNLLKALMEGTDMHCLRLAATLKEPYEHVLAIVNDKEHPDHKRYKQMRTDIKPKSFAAQYGASAHGISFATGCTIEEAQAFLDAEAALFPQAFTYKSIVREMVEATGVHNLCREMTDDGRFVTYHRGHFKAAGGTCYSYREYPTWREGQQIMDYKETQLANYWCQGEASFIVQAACGRVIRWLIINDFFGGCVLPVNTIHDAVYHDCVNEEWAKYAGKVTQEILEDTPSWLASIIPAYKEWNYHTTPFPAVAEYGANMMDKVKC
jgi:DNA polymerase I-like protein with 3'-5' exonuclease and polymerase domains